MPQRLLIAIGGNAIHPDNIRGTPEEQLALARATGRALRPIMQLGRELVITHGNGPEVGEIHLRMAIARRRVPPMPLDTCVAQSQGSIAYLLMQAFENALREIGSPRRVVALLTEVEVDPNDPAFARPTKPIGPHYDAAEAAAVAAELGWDMREEKGRGWRHVVASPQPKHVVDIPLIRTLAREGAVVIAGGGGGIPVVRAADGTRRGIEAVIDKDLTSAHMARALDIDEMMILTAVSHVAADYGRPSQRDLGRVTLSEIKALQAAGHFPAGSMGPKIEAAIRFLETGGKRVVVGHLNEALAALRGETGTHVVPDGG